MIVYLFNLIFSCLYLYFVKANSLTKFLLKISPVILLWTIIVGGQYFVGRDYESYLGYFHIFYDNRFEPFFKILTKLLINHGLNDQWPFFIFAAINAIIIFIASYKLGIKYWAIFYFLLITVSTFFNNQMNGLRECLAATFCFWAFVEFYNSKLKGFILVCIAIGFHYSAAVCIIFIYITKLTQYGTKYPRLLLCFTLILSFLNFDNLSLNNQLLDFISIDLIDENTNFRSYYNIDVDSINPIYRISKIVYIPIYWYSLKLLYIKELTSKERLFFKFGFLSFNLKTILLINHFIGRFSYYFWIPSILPIYYLIRYYYNKRNTFAVIFILFYVSIIYFIKIFIGENEYHYDFFLLHK